MFHRVKSETSVEDLDSPVQHDAVEAQKQGEAAAHVAQRARNATTLSQASAAEAEEAPKAESVQASSDDTQEADKAGYSPAKSLYQAPTAGRQAASYAPRAGTGYSTSHTPAATDSSDNDRRLTIGRGITMSGEIECCDELQVEGTVEAALKGATFLNIASSGVFYGTVEIQDAVVAGRFEGELVVNGRLTVEETGVITGTISYKELEIKSGAIVDGRITPLSAQAGSKAG